MDFQLKTLAFAKDTRKTRKKSFQKIHFEFNNSGMGDLDNSLGILPQSKWWHELTSLFPIAIMETISSIREIEASIVRDPKNTNSILEIKKVTVYQH